MNKLEKPTISLKKVNIALVVFLSIISLGIYTCYWFLNRKTELEKMREQTFIPFKGWIVFLVLLSFTFLMIFIGPFILTPYGMAVFDSVDMIISSYFLAILYFSVFRTKELLEGYVDEPIFKSWLLVLFHIWYVQYKINRIFPERGDLGEVKQFAKAE